MPDFSGSEEYLLFKIRERREEVREFMARGQIKDHTEYKQLCGLIQGLEFASNLITDLAKRREREEDNE